MIRNVKRQYFEIWGSEESQNTILKWLVLYFVSIVIIESVGIVVLANRNPKIVAIGEQKSQVLTLKQPKKEILEDELERTVRNYAITHYSWNYTTIESAHREAAKYVSEKFQKLFLKANEEQVRFVKEKKVSQKVYISEPIKIDTKSLAARVNLDRIYNIDGLSGSSPIILDLRFEYGPRTEDNPEGIYIVDEKLVVQDGNGR